MRAIAKKKDLDAPLPLMETLTARDFFAFTDARPDEERWELLDGVIDMSPSPSLLHQIILKNLLKHLGRLEDEAARAWMVVPGFGLRVSDLNVPVPDLLIRPNALIEGSECDDALVAIEIQSPSTAHRDRRVKRVIYTSLPALQHYVIVAQDNVAVLFYERRDGFTEKKIGGSDGILDIPVLGISLPLADIYRNTGL